LHTLLIAQRRWPNCVEKLDEWMGSGRALRNVPRHSLTASLFCVCSGFEAGRWAFLSITVAGADYGHTFEWCLSLQMRSGFIDAHRSLPFHRIVFVWIWRRGRDVIGISDGRFYCLVTIWHDFFIEMIFSLPNRGREQSDEQRTMPTALGVESSIPCMRNSSSADDPDADCGNPAISSFEFR